MWQERSGALVVYVYNMPTQVTREDLEQVFAPLLVSIKVTKFSYDDSLMCNKFWFPPFLVPFRFFFLRESVCVCWWVGGCVRVCDSHIKIELSNISRSNAKHVKIEPRTSAYCSIKKVKRNLL